MRDRFSSYVDSASVDACCYAYSLFESGAFQSGRLGESDIPLLLAARGFSRCVVADAFEAAALEYYCG